MPPPASSDLPSEPLARLVAIMQRLRDPEAGCPWDREQTLRSLAPHLLEEAYEVVEAVELGSPEAVREELGDVLFQVVFYAQLGREEGLWDLDAIARAVGDKMIERHPHVFGTRRVETSRDVLRHWEADKAARRAAKAPATVSPAPPSLLEGISTAMPAAARAQKLQERAARVGFEWVNTQAVIAKVREELAELEAEIDAKTPNPDALEDEMGDVLFVALNLARRLGVDPETALRRTNRKFERRFRGIEEGLAAEGRAFASASLADMERLWQAVKQAERA